MNERCTILQQDVSCWHELHNPLSPTLFFKFWTWKFTELLILNTNKSHVSKVWKDVMICRYLSVLLVFQPMDCIFVSTRKQSTVFSSLYHQSRVSKLYKDYACKCYACNFCFSLTSFTARNIDSFIQTLWVSRFIL